VQCIKILNYITKISNKAFEIVAKFEHLSMKVAKQNYIHEEVKIALNS